MISDLANILLCCSLTRIIMTMTMNMEKTRDPRLIDYNTDNTKHLSDGPGSDDLKVLEFDSDLNNGDAFEELLKFND